MDMIRQGSKAEFTLTLTQNGAAFPLSNTTATLTVMDSSLVTVLIQSISINMFGTVISSDGLELGPGGADAGVLVQTLTPETTAALPLGMLSWSLKLIDTNGDPSWPLWGQYNVVRPTFFVDVSGPGMHSLAELRRRTANRLGDYTMLRSTAASDSSHFTDALNISGATETLNGRFIVVRNGPNMGHVARVQNVSEATNTLTITPEAPAGFTAGVILDCFNTRSRGWAPWEYDEAINEAIVDGQPLRLAEYTAYLSTFDAGLPYFAIPDLFTWVNDVASLDTRTGLYTSMPSANGHGWGVRKTPSGPIITISRHVALIADDAGLQITGHGTYPKLVSDADQTGMPSEWLTARAAYRLAVNGLTRDDTRGNLIMVLQDEERRAETQMRTFFGPHEVQVR